MKNDSPPSIAKALLGTGGMLLAHSVAGLVVFFVLCRVVPVYLRFFEDTEAALPAVTQGLIHASMLMVNYWFLLLVVFLVLDGAILLGCDLLLPRQRWTKACWHTAVLLAVILFLGFAALALGLPLYSGPKKLV